MVGKQVRLRGNHTYDLEEILDLIDTDRYQDDTDSIEWSDQDQGFVYRTTLQNIVHWKNWPGQELWYGPSSEYYIKFENNYLHLIDSAHGETWAEFPMSQVDPEIEKTGFTLIGQKADVPRLREILESLKISHVFGGMFL